MQYCINLLIEKERELPVCKANHLNTPYDLKYYDIAMKTLKLPSAASSDNVLHKDGKACFSWNNNNMRNPELCSINVILD
jgi:hypothetical protein